MSNVLVLFNLKEGVDSAEYERWAKTRDLPTARNLSCLLYTSPSPRDRTRSRMPSSA